MSTINLKVNINVTCRVILTEAGAKHLNDHNTNLLKWSGAKPSNIYKKNDVFETQLWDLMNIFGSMLYMGNNELPFKENDIALIGSN